jgi:hypothetical protein
MPATRPEAQLWRLEMGALDVELSQDVAAICEPTVTMTAATYRRLLATADMAPLYVLPIPPVFLQRAATLGYTHIRNVRLLPRTKLANDLGEDATASILSVLATFGLTELE